MSLVWKNVPDAKRRDIYDEYVSYLAKRDKEAAKAQNKRNMRQLAAILDSMIAKHWTTWEEAQKMLLDNPNFADDASLLGMDKELQLIVYEAHIRKLEKKEEEEEERENIRNKRQDRKNRDNFKMLLDELHEQGKLTSMSLWVELYPIISADPRFSAMLGQPGSTPLDLFKFYVEDLKSRFPDESKILTEILQERNFEVKVTTTFEEFATVVCKDRRSATLDAGNAKLTYHSLLEKAEAREKERQEDENRRLRKLESAFRVLLRDLDVDHHSSWYELRDKLANHDVFGAIGIESECLRIFKEYQHEIEEARNLHSKSKKNKKKKKRSRSSYEEYQHETEEASNLHLKSKKSKKNKKKNKRSRSSSEGTSSKAT